MWRLRLHAERQYKEAVFENLKLLVGEYSVTNLLFGWQCTPLVLIEMGFWISLICSCWWIMGEIRQLIHFQLQEQPGCVLYITLQWLSMMNQSTRSLGELFIEDFSQTVAENIIRVFKLFYTESDSGNKLAEWNQLEVLQTLTISIKYCTYRNKLFKNLRLISQLAKWSVINLWLTLKM